MTRLKFELDKSKKTEIHWFDELKACLRESQELRERTLTVEVRDRILAALEVGKQSPQYKRVKAVLDQFIV